MTETHVKIAINFISYWTDSDITKLLRLKDGARGLSNIITMVSNFIGGKNRVFLESKKLLTWPSSKIHFHGPSSKIHFHGKGSKVNLYEIITL